MRAKEDIQLIFKHTPRDYRSTELENCILYGHPEKGTILGSIEGMPESVYQAKLEAAKREERKEWRDQVLKPVYKRYGIDHLLLGTRQFRDSFKEIIDFALPAVKPKLRAKFVCDLKQAGISHNWEL